jgi:ABC-type nitrate/sulfonate/bicarbonate transport system substrate-binding protein
MKRSAVLAGFAGSAALATVPRIARAAGGTPLRIALLPIDTDSLPYYAQELGYFQQAGIDADISVIQAGSSVVSAIVGGSLDIGFTNPISLAAAHLSGIPIVAIAAAGIYQLHEVPTAAILVPKNSPVRTAKDLNGKIMACSGLKNLGQWAPALWIDKNGGDSSTVKFVEMPFPEMPVALATGRVDSAFPAEPFITIAKDSSRIFGDAFASVAPRFNLGIWVTSQQWADSHKDVARAFANVMSKTAAWSNANHAQSAGILAKYAKLETSVASSMARVPNATSLQAGDLQPVIDLAVKYGTLARYVPADQLIYRT